MKDRKFSIIIPIFNEEKNITILVDEILSNLKSFDSFEIIIVNDGSTDNSLKEINILKKNNSKIKLLNLKKNMGQSYALREGIISSNFNSIVTIDGDGQNNPKDIPMLLNIFFKNKFICLVGGIRVKRKDSFTKKLTSKMANILRSFILNDNCIDTGCSLKVFEKKIFLQFPYFSGMHRFLPALFLGYGTKTTFVNVDHRARTFGKSKYDTLGRFVRGVRDIIKVILIIREIKKNRV